MNKLILGFLIGLIAGIWGGVEIAGVRDEDKICVCLPVPPGRGTPEATPAAQAPLATEPATEPVIATAPVVQPFTPLTGLAILGDSVEDEYRADNPRGGEYNATTLNWVELLVTQRGVNVGPWGTRAEPRRSGYAYNWARSGATTDQMLTQGQLDGVLAQIESGDVSHVVIQIGINDFYFSGLGLEIYEGSLSDAEVRARLNAIAGNVLAAAQTIQEKSDVPLIVAATQNYFVVDVVPEFHTVYTDPLGQLRLKDAFAQFDDLLREQAEAQGIHFFDYNAAFLEEYEARSDGNGLLIVGGEAIDLRTRGNDPHFGLLDDEYVHPGTVLSSLITNAFIKEFNRTFGTAIAPLSDEEILRAAGIRP